MAAPFYIIMIFEGVGKWAFPIPGKLHTSCDPHNSILRKVWLFCKGAGPVAQNLRDMISLVWMQT